MRTPRMQPALDPIPLLHHQAPSIDPAPRLAVARPERRRTATVCLLLATLCAGLPARAADAPAPAPDTLRLMTYNIHHGEGLDGKLDLDRIADLIRREQADLVALQEVDRGVQRTHRRDLPAELARATGLHCVFSNNYAFQGGEYGNAILSRWPIQSSSNTHYRMLRPGEQRGLLQVTVHAAGHPLVFMATHIDHRPDDAERWANIEEIERLARAYGQTPVVVAGDFNDLPESRVCRRMQSWALDAWSRVGEGPGYTYPASQPRRRIDYVWIARGSPLQPLRAWIPDSQASDHRPLVVECRWSPPATPPPQ